MLPRISIVALAALAPCIESVATSSTTSAACTWPASLGGVDAKRALVQLSLPGGPPRGA
jgi:hypothetical protein